MITLANIMLGIIVIIFNMIFTGNTLNYHLISRDSAPPTATQLANMLTFPHYLGKCPKMQCAVYCGYFQNCLSFSVRRQMSDNDIQCQCQLYTHLLLNTDHLVTNQGVQYYGKVNLNSAGNDFRRQTPTSVDVRL